MNETLSPAEEIKKPIFSFRDIVILDDRTIQRILREVDCHELSKALKSVNAAVQDKIVNNMSKPAAKMLKEDMEFMGPVRLKDVEEAQLKIVSIIKHLKDTGEIVIPDNFSWEVYEAIREASLSPAKEDETKDRIGELIAKIETAVQSGGILDLYGNFTLEDIQLGFEAFQPRQEELKRIKKLDIGGDLIEGAIPLFELGLLEHLKVHHLYNEAVVHLPESIGKCKNLKSLALSSRINEIPGWVQNLTKLEILEINGKCITMLPEWLWELPITELTLRYLSFIPDGIGKLTTLRTLDLSFGGFSSLPESIGNLTALRELDLRYSKISTLPDSIGKLQDLVKLDVPGTALETLPESFAKLSTITSLDFNDLPIHSLPESIGGMSSLTSLSLDNTRITNLPEGIGNLSALTSLSLKHTGITSLPENARKLLSLTNLDLGHTKIALLPDWMVDLTSLESLAITNTKITELPEWIGTMPALKKLCLSRTEIEDLPNSVVSNKNLHIHDTGLVPSRGSLSYDDFVSLCLSLIKKITDLSEKARREGLLALEEELDDIDDKCFVTGLRLVLDGTDAEVVRFILTKYMEQEQNYYRKILRRLELEGILGIQAGDNPWTLFLLLDSMIRLPIPGYTDAFNKYLNGREDALDDILNHIPNRPSLKDREEVRFITHAIEYAELARRESLLAIEEQLDRKAITAKDVFEYGMLFAINGINSSFINKVLTNLIDLEADPVKRTLGKAKKEAVLSIQAGDNPRIIALKVCSFFEEDIRQVVERQVMEEGVRQINERDTWHEMERFVLFNLRIF